MKKFQECHPLEKMWRYRHLLMVPYEAVKIWILAKKFREEIIFKEAWHISVGLAQVKMHWVYSWDEED